MAGAVTDSTVMGMKRRLVTLAGILSATGLVAGPLRRLSSRSGVWDEEVAQALPGDDLVAGAGHVIDRAATIPAPAESVWQWIVQMGKQRAGWYFPRWVELAIPRGRRGFRTVDPSLLDLVPGQRVPDWGPGDPQFEVAQIEPEQALVYLSLRQKSRNWTWPDRVIRCPKTFWPSPGRWCCGRSMRRIAGCICVYGCAPPGKGLRRCSSAACSTG